MTQVVQRVSSSGLQLPKELIEQWGLKEGQEVLIELERFVIRIVPVRAMLVKRLPLRLMLMKLQMAQRPMSLTTWVTRRR